MLELKSTQNIDSFEKGPLRRSLFTNGATSIFHKAKGMVGAKVNLYFLAGSVVESPGEYGLTHMIEHMIFKEDGTDLITELENAGAEINAYTYKEYVCFEMSCMSKNLTKLLPKYLDLFMNLNLKKTELEREKKVIIQELKEDLDDHETAAFEKLFDRAFPKCLGHSIGGTIKNVKSFRETDLRIFHTRNFAPDRMLLTVVAGSEFSKLEQLYITAMNQHYMFKAKKPHRLRAKNKNANIKSFKVKMTRKMESAILLLSFPGPSLNSSKFYDFVVLDDLLFEGLSSVFFKKLREEDPLVYGLGSSINSFQENGNYVMVFNTQKFNITKIKKIVKKTLKEFETKPFPAEQIEMIKNRLLDNWILSFDDIAERAEYLSDCEIYQLDEISIEQVTEKINKVTPKTINKLIKNILNADLGELVMAPQG